MSVRGARASRRSFVGAAVALCAGCVSPPRGAIRPRPVALDDLELVADGLDRPEGVIAYPDGRVVVSSAAGACTIIDADGSRRTVGAAPHANGIAPDGPDHVIVANYGLLDGVPGVLQRVDLRSGETVTLADAVGGRALVASNFPALGPDGAVYCTHTHWGDPYNIGATRPEGFIYRVAPDGAVSVVFAGLRMANGLCFSADGEHLFVAQTAAADVLRLTRRGEGVYGAPRRWGPRFGAAPDDISAQEIRAMPAPQRAALGHTDGLALDVAGNLWVTLPFANTVCAVTPQGERIDVVADPQRRKLDHVTNIAFGGAERNELYIASMRNNALWKARVGVAGVALHARALRATGE